jgi:hypothetical protein
MPHGGGPGMPQLDFSTFPNQIFWLVVTLIAIYFILTRSPAADRLRSGRTAGDADQ